MKRNASIPTCYHIKMYFNVTDFVIEILVAERQNTNVF